MMNLICAAKNNTGSIIIYAVLIIVLIAMLVMPYFTQKKKNQEFVKMLESMKVGDLVKTAGGIIGKIKKISDKGDFKTVILETGSKNEKSYMEFDMTMIYCVLKSTKAQTEESDKVEETITNEEVPAETVETPAEVVAEAPVEAKEEKSAKKTTTKKTAAKKTTKKSSK